MKIGIDCRMSGIKHAGIGRYVENLVNELKILDKQNQYVFFNRTDIPHYSLKEQLCLPFLLYRERLNLMHFPHFNVPILYFGKYVLTVHDLIKHISKGVETTTKSPWLYWLKYLGYKVVFWFAVKKAVKILVPSQFVKNELVKEYHLNSEKVVVTYEGVDNKITNPKSQIPNKLQILNKYEITKPYLLYVGSVYPHKNIERLIEAIKALEINLVIACSRGVFWERLRKKVQENRVENFVNLAGFVPDEELSVLYREAEAFVFPTLSEGFGLPGLEAMANRCPVICSDIPVLREVYGEAAEYFDPLVPEDMAEKIKRVTDHEDKKNQMVEKGFEQLKKYSWRKMASETLAVYNSSSK